MIPSCLYFLSKKRLEFDFLKERFLKKENERQKLSALKKRSENVLDRCAAKCN